MFEVAYFWRLDPGRMLDLPLSEASLYEQQAGRIAEILKPPER